jgi:Helicase subunit of the DNA excision repair complex
MFNLKSEYKPAGDQPQAIEKLVNGINKGDKFQTLLGVTGSRKNFYNGKCYTTNSKTNPYFGT